MNLDVLAGWISLVLTLFIFSYILSDNFLYRIAVHLLVGSAAGYVAIVAMEGVVKPWVEATLLDSDAAPAVRALGVVPMLFAIGLILKQSMRLSRLGNPFLAVIIGVGTGVAIVGAVVGTIIPLVRETSDAFETEGAFNAVVAVSGTVGTLVYFQYLAVRRIDGSVKRSIPIRFLAGVGRVFIVITLGAIYGGMIVTSLTVLSGVIQTQLTFLLEQIG